MARKTVKAKDLKKQRWAPIVALVLAVGMVLSLLGAFIGSLIVGSAEPRPGAQDDLVMQDPQEMIGLVREEIERLEDYLEEHGAVAPVLVELVGNYSYLLSLLQMQGAELDDLSGEFPKLAAHYEALVELEPNEPLYRFDLIYLYNLMGEDEKIAAQVGFLDAHYSGLVETGTAALEDRYYYALFFLEFFGDREAAIEQLKAIIDSEEAGEDDYYYRQAEWLLESLETESGQADSAD